METWIDVAGLRIQSPVTVVTSLVIGMQCAFYHRRLRANGSDRSVYWSLFFLAMAVANLAAAPKHGLRQALPGDVYNLVLWTSGLAGALSVYYAQRATVASRARHGTAPLWLTFCRLEVWLYLAGGVVFGPETWLVVANTAVGLVPVIVVEAAFAVRGRPEAAWIVAGLGVSLLTGVIYLGEVALSPWFDHVDAAHVLMLLSFALIVRGGVGDERALVHALGGPERGRIA